ncbi:MAG: hypothetical protein JW860_06320 [Sedimentisphaerales bacterium]|nr:hypothetical protein [Sedimentisphaerales bacterium]
MAKKIILLVSTLMVVLLCLLIFQQTMKDVTAPTERHSIPDIPIKEGQAESGQTYNINGNRIEDVKIEGPTFKTLDEDGNVTRTFGYDQHLSDRDDAIEVSEPWVKIYGKDNRIIDITAPLGQVPLDVSDGQLQQEPTRGSLLGGVHIEIYQLQHTPDLNIQDNTRKNIEYIVDMDQIDFEREFSQLNSSGKINVQGRQISLQGAGLTMQYDQVNEQLQLLVLRQVQELRIQADLFGSLSQKSISDSTRSLDKSSPEKIKTARKPVPYRITLSDEVAVVQNQNKLSADKIEILLNQDFSQTLDQGASSQTDDKMTSPKTGTSAIEDDTQTTILTCKGSLRITAAGSIDNPLLERTEFVGSGRPVRIWDLANQNVLAQADRIQYSDLDQTIQLLPVSTPGDVSLFLGPQQFARAQRGIMFDQNNNQARLSGPGTIQSNTPQNDQPTVINFQDELLVKFTGSDSSTLTSEGRQIQWLEFTGLMQADIENNHIRAEKGRLDFFASAPSKNSKSALPPVRTIELHGSVKASDKDSYVSCQDLSAKFAQTAANESALKLLTTAGDVRFEDPNWLVQVSRELQLHYDEISAPAKPQLSQTDSDNDKQQTSSFGLGRFADLSRPDYVLAQGPAGGVIITNKQDHYQITGDRAEGNPKKGSMSISGNPARAELAQQGKLESNLITIDLNAEVCSIPQEGKIVLITDMDMTGQKTTEPLPLEISWQDRSEYHLNTNQIDFYDARAQITQLSSDGRMVNILTCPRMSAILGSQTQPQTSRKLTEFTAHGPNVKLLSTRYAPADDVLTSNMELICSQLRYHKSSDQLLLQGEGIIEIIDYQPRKKQTPRSQNSLDNLLAGAFAGPQETDPAYSLIHFLDQMLYDINTSEIIFPNGVALHRVPLAKKLKARLDDNLTEMEGMVRLHCDKLRVVQTSSDEKPAPPAGTESQAIDYLQAYGNVIFEANQPGSRRYFFAGDELTYEKTQYLVKIRGTETSPVQFILMQPGQYNHMQLLRADYHLATGDFAIKPTGHSILSRSF